MSISPQFTIILFGQFLTSENASIKKFVVITLSFLALCSVALGYLYFTLGGTENVIRTFRDFMEGRYGEAPKGETEYSKKSQEKPEDSKEALKLTPNYSYTYFKRGMAKYALGDCKSRHRGLGKGSRAYPLQ